ncbi:hypothetical protein GP486_003331 [Trichoglossum hirsutum]|uniref:DNA 3'-5' helicase n=1 Tax=Trichoglossum hirsutum TaxID=265104 RepID=A0A9P8LDB7_9PEZI|nr:hypothetical protein GP486_003331 [Trichoglossum hirsutum]
MRESQSEGNDGKQALPQTEVILEGLNAAQRAAVASPALVLQVLAPPGSGKTKTLTARVAYLLCRERLQPWNVIVATFTVKAAREMKERIGRLIGDGLEAKLVLGTFHSIARRYLVRYGHLIGIDRGFGIADSADSLGIIKRIIKRRKLNIDPGVARSRISNAKAQGMGHSEYLAQTSGKKNVDTQEFAIVYEEYEDALAKSNLLDYDNLLLRCVELLRQHPSCVSNVEAVLVDEFQDTNIVQFDLMRLFSAYRKRVTIVGDPDQSIYGFRSAEIKNLKRMQRQYPDTLVVILEENYRSSGAILLAALEVIQQDESRPAKALLPTHCVGTRPVMRKLPSAGIEALWIVSEIKRVIALTGHLFTLNDFAILVRSASLSRHIESALGKSGVPYRMVGGFRFFDRTEVKTVLDYLRVISQPDGNDALARIINVPPRRIGETTVKALLDEAETKKITLWSLLGKAAQESITLKTKIPKPAEQRLSAFVNLIISTRKKLLQSDTAQFSPVQLLEFLMKKLSFREYLEKSHPEDHEARWANVEELIAQASDFSGSASDEHEDEEALPVIEGLEQRKSSSPSDNLSRFLANVALSSEVKDSDAGPGDRITISTIHAAKGLEWPVVFVPAAYDGSIPHSRAEDTDEERRLLYVAMTRAKALLYMSCPTKNSQKEQTTLSKFLSHKSLTPHLERKGPSFNYGLIQSISRILNRDCPSEAGIAGSREEAQALEDNLWPLTGEEKEIGENKGRSWEPDDQVSLPQERALKRRRHRVDDASQHPTDRAQSLVYASSTTTSITTMQNSMNFSIASTTMTAGFVSAGSYLQELGKARLNCAADEERSRVGKGREPVQAVAPMTQDHPLKAAGLRHPGRPSNQSSLTSFFVKTASGKEDLNAGRRELESTLRPKPTREIDPLEEPGFPVQQQRAPTHRIPGALQPAISPTLARHRPRAVPLPHMPLCRPTTPEAGQKPKPYLFLSSSPCAVAEVSGEKGGEERGGDGPSTESPLSVKPGKHTASIGATEGNDVQTSGPPHTASMLRASGGGSGTTSAGAGGAFQRKTLGVRRSMNGWANRPRQGQRGFVVPGKSR